jgi:hypothetical protein
MVWPLCSLTYTWAEDILSTWNLQKKKKNPSRKTLMISENVRPLIANKTQSR